MITWILGPLVIIWCLVARFREGGKIEGQPLGMPKGTVRTIITLMIVSFPFSSKFLMNFRQWTNQYYSNMGFLEESM